MFHFPGKALYYKIPRWFRILAVITLVFIIVIGIVTTIIVWSSGDPDYNGELADPLATSPSASRVTQEDKQQLVSNIPQYIKGEEQTYLTLPEWYLVFNPNEYAQYLTSGNNPSNFPYLASIDEYWRLYDRVMHLTTDIYPENNEYKTMLNVIGISTTVEFLIKGFYETTVGRFSFWTASNSTPEDLHIQQAHTAYSNLIYHEPWYVFPFSEWLGKIWTDTPFFGPNFIRKMERKILFTLEFGFKTIYAKLIGLGATSTNDPSDGKVKMHVILPIDMKTDRLEVIDNRISELHDFGGDERIISIPRWGGFTEIIPKLASNKVQFIEIAGNEDILVTVITDKGRSVQLSDSQYLFDSLVISPKGKQRLVYSIKVAALADFINALDKYDLILEHIYDY